jgi:hypothetical protein
MKDSRHTKGFDHGYLGIEAEMRFESGYLFIYLFILAGRTGV